MKNTPLPQKISIEEKYDPAMRIRTQKAADKYLEKCVQHTMSWGKSREEATRIERANLGYYAGYFDTSTRARVERLFRCSHPIFGAVSTHGIPSVTQCLEAGEKMGRKMLTDKAGLSAIRAFFTKDKDK